MNTKIFRRAAIERLSSPEELDQVISISVGAGWAALAAILLFCAGALVWAVTAALPTTASGSGMIVSAGGVLNVVSRGAGVVQSIDVSVGQHVAANQVIAMIAQPALSSRVQAMRQELDQVVQKHKQDLELKTEEIRIRSEATARQRANIERSIAELKDQAVLASQRIPVMEQLFSRGLVTNQQVLDARQTLIELNGQAADRTAQLKQLDAQEFELRTQKTSLDAAMQLEIASRQREIEAAMSDLTLQETVSTPQAGHVVEIKVSPGGTIDASTPVLTIQPDADTLEVLTYVSSLQAKDIRVGMAARISPSTVKREEHGYVLGKVIFVPDYPATLAAVMRNFQNEQMVQSLAGSGPVTEVRLALEPDVTTTSGFRWSSPGGPPVKLSAGTIATAEIVTATRAPITLVIPILRQKLGL
jgi:HlyD family secretion protein